MNSPTIEPIQLLSKVVADVEAKLTLPKALWRRSKPARAYSSGGTEWHIHRKGPGILSALKKKALPVVQHSDIFGKVTAEGIDPHTTHVSQVMTRNPMVTRDTTSATEALQLMVERHFRHLVCFLCARPALA